MRGEYPFGPGLCKRCTELPPRARRIRLGWSGRFRRCGTTSACAENTRTYKYIGMRLRNYLRVRGEYAASRLEMTGCMELPPRARRILFHIGELARIIGTTSACAENTGRGCFWSVLARNYLRVRGEYCRSVHFCSVLWELPPRARRIPLAVTAALGLLGTTSACAENTPIIGVSDIRLRNYLRVRGEYLDGRPAYGAARELPPRARRIQGH